METAPPDAVAAGHQRMLEAAEERCLRLVAVAEAKGREERAALEAQVAQLQEDNRRIVAASADTVAQCERTLHGTATAVEAAAARFGVEHEQATAAMGHLLEARGQCEGRLLQRVKVAISTYDDRRRDARLQSFQALLARAAGADDPGAGYRRAFMAKLGAALQQQSHTPDPDMPFMLDAVCTYLAGAVATLAAFGDAVHAELCDRHAVEQQAREGRLLAPEREVLQRNARALAPPDVVVADRALADVFLARIADSATERREALLIALREAMARAACDARAFLGRSTAACVEAMQRAATPSAPEPQRLTPPRDRRGEDPLASTFPGLFSATSGGGAPVGEHPAELVRQVQEAAEAAGEHVLTSMARRHAADMGRVTTQAAETTALTRAAVAEAEALAPVVQHRTVFDFDAMDGARSRSAVTRRLVQERGAMLEDRAGRQQEALRRRIAHLEADLEATRTECTAQTKRADRLASELEHLMPAALARARTAIAEENAQAAVNAVRAAMPTADADGDCASVAGTAAETVASARAAVPWQEALLVARTQHLTQVQQMHTRLLARVRAMLEQTKRTEGDIEALFEERLQASVLALTRDHDLRCAAAEGRFAVERRRLHDEAQHRARLAHLDAEERVRTTRDEAQREYERRVSELNDLFDERVRRLQLRAEEAEAYFVAKVQELRRTAHEKENALQLSLTHKFIAHVEEYDRRSLAMKKDARDREQQLERERLNAVAEMEARVNDRVQAVRRSFEQLAEELQQETARCLGVQRRACEEMRDREQLIYAHYLYQAVKLHQQHAAAGFAEATGQLEARQSKAEAARLASMRELQLAHEAAVHARDVTCQQRVDDHKQRVESVLRATQVLRSEQEDGFWADCAAMLRDGNEAVVEAKAHLETLLQERYTHIIAKCQEFLNKDMMAAHHAFERECKLRHAQLQAYVRDAMTIQLRSEGLLWEEAAARGALEKAHQGVLLSITVREMEHYRSTQFHAAWLRSPEEVEAAEEKYRTFSSAEVAALREAYEGRLLEQQQFVTNIAHDHLTAMAAHLQQHEHDTAHTRDVLASRYDIAVAALRARFDSYASTRDALVAGRVEGLARAVRRAATEFLRTTDGPADDDGSPPRGGGFVVDLPDDLDSTQRSAASASASAFASASASKPVRSRGGRRAVSASAPATARRGLRSISPSAANTANGGVPSDAPRPSPSGKSGVVGMAHVHTADHRMVEYFSDVRALVSKTMADVGGHIEAARQQWERTRSDGARELHVRYLDATDATLRRVEAAQAEASEAGFTAQRALRRAEAASAEDARAAEAAADMLLAAARYRDLSARWMLGGAAPDEDRGAERPLRWFVTDLGAKDATRGAVLEAAQLRDHVVAAELRAAARAGVLPSVSE